MASGGLQGVRAGGRGSSEGSAPLLHLLLMFLLVPTTATLRIKEYCETEQLNATCPHPDDVILMRHARYGRMRMGRCVKLDYGHVGCSSDVLDLADSRCSGRKQCIIRIPDALFAQTKPCPDDLKPYMEATFECVRVIMPKEQTCVRSSSLMSTAQAGYLSSVVSMETGCGRRDTPWKLTVKPGQRINISLYDFGATATPLSSSGSSGTAGENEVAGAIASPGATSQGSGGSRPLTQCRVYAMIRERTVHRMRNITVCGTKSRERNVYISLTNSVEIGLIVGGGAVGSSRDKGKGTPLFLIKYEAVGCPDLEAGDHSWIMRKQNDVIVGCNHTSESWHLKCEGTEWVGKSGNCSIHSAAVPNRNHKDDRPLSYGSSILIIIAVALTIGVVVLAAGLLCLRKQRARFCGSTDVTTPDESDGEEEKTYVDRNYFHYGWTQKAEVPSPSKDTSGAVRPVGLVNEYGQIAGTQPCTPLLKKENRPTIYGPALPPCTCSHLTPSLYRLDGPPPPRAGRRGSLEGQLQDAEPFLGGSNPEQHQHYFVLDPDVLGGTRTYGRIAPKGKGLGARGNNGKQEEIYQLRTLKPMAPLTELDKAAAMCDCHKQYVQQEQQHQQQQQQQQPKQQQQPPGAANANAVNVNSIAKPQQQQPQTQNQSQPAQQIISINPQQQQHPPQPQQQLKQQTFNPKPLMGPATAPKPQSAGPVLGGAAPVSSAAGVGGVGSVGGLGVVGVVGGLPPSRAYAGAANEYVDNDVNERRNAPDGRHVD